MMTQPLDSAIGKKNCHRGTVRFCARPCFGLAEKKVLFTKRLMFWLCDRILKM